MLRPSFAATHITLPIKQPQWRTGTVDQINSDCRRRDGLGELRRVDALGNFAQSRAAARKRSRRLGDRCVSERKRRGLRDLGDGGASRNTWRVARIGGVGWGLAANRTRIVARAAAMDAAGKRRDFDR